MHLKAWILWEILFRFLGSTKIRILELGIRNLVPGIGKKFLLTESEIFDGEIYDFG